MHESSDLEQAHANVSYPKTLQVRDVANAKICRERSHLVLPSMNRFEMIPFQFGSKRG